MKLDGQLNFTKSEFHRESPDGGAGHAPPRSGVTVNYTNGEVPTIAHQHRPQQPGELRLGRRAREPAGGVPRHRHQGRALQLHLGRQELQRASGRGLRRHRRAASPRTTTPARGRPRPAATIRACSCSGPNGAPPCNGASTPGASAAALYPGYGTGYTAGQTAPLLVPGLAHPAREPAELPHSRTRRLRHGRLEPLRGRFALRALREHRARKWARRTRAPASATSARRRPASTPR